MVSACLAREAARSIRIGDSSCLSAQQFEPASLWETQPV